MSNINAELQLMYNREYRLREFLSVVDPESGVAIRDMYDYVFIDCPPAEIVADASIVGRYVDLTLFVIRAKVMERAFLPEIENWYEEKKFTNLSIILNGTEAGGGRYGYHKYGYHRYGYGYGKYGYGAYGYGVKEETADA